MPSKQITYLDIAVHFDLVINKAASLLGVCTTVLKRTCRANGIGRWPQRKLHSITKMMTSLDLTLQTCGARAFRRAVARDAAHRAAMHAMPCEMQ